MQAEQIQALLQDRSSQLAHDNAAHVDRGDGTRGLVLLDAVAVLVELVEDAGQLVNVLADGMKEEIVEGFEQHFGVLENALDQFPFLGVVQLESVGGDKLLELGRGDSGVTRN